MAGLLTRQLFQVSLAPYLRMLELWIYEGQLSEEADPHHEFAFVHAHAHAAGAGEGESGTDGDDNGDDSPTTASSSSLSLHRIHIPTFFTNADIDMIVRIGQLMRVLRCETTHEHAACCVLDAAKLRRTRPETFGSFGISLEFRAEHSLTALRAATQLWGERAAALASTIANARLTSEVAARRELDQLVEGLRARRHEFEDFALRLEALEARDAADDHMAKRVLLEELKADAAQARARRYADRMAAIEQELESLRQRERLPRYVFGAIVLQALGKQAGFRQAGR